MSLLNSMLERITSVYTKAPNTNIYKLFQIISEEIQLNNDLLEKIRLYKDIDEAEGEALDRIGQNVQQNRNQEPDEKYRISLKIKIARNVSNGSIDAIVSIIAMILGTDESEIFLQEGHLFGEAALLKLYNMPLQTLIDAGITPEEFIERLGQITPAGVGFDDFLFLGTFEFGDTPLENNINQGFANNEQTIGGFLGQIFSS